MRPFKQGFQSRQNKRECSMFQSFVFNGLHQLVLNVCKSLPPSGIRPIKIFLSKGRGEKGGGYRTGAFWGQLQLFTAWTLDNL
jgi:hypothetical protein